jgi:hypothetical protein
VAEPADAAVVALQRAVRGQLHRAGHERLW